MRSRSIAATAALLASLTGQPSAADPPNMVPGGSYLDTCKNVRFDPATNLLAADCDAKPRGAWEGEAVRSGMAFNITGCISNSIFNADGDLYCYSEKPWGKDHVIPQGSYLASCAHSHVTNNVLIATCDDSSDTAWSAELDLNQCRWGGDIANEQGGLTCEKLAAGQAAGAPLVKPVGIAPLVRPVTIAPVGGTAPSGTTAPEVKRKKGERKKRDLGERG